jgi:hypothetical protein
VISAGFDSFGLFEDSKEFKMTWTDITRSEHGQIFSRYPRWGGCRPTHTASQCAKEVVLITIEQKGRQP